MGMNAVFRRAIMNTTNRRGFLKGAASVGAFAVLAEGAQLHTGSGAAPGRVRAWRTTKDQKFQPFDSPQWEPWSGTLPTGIHLDPGRRYQEILGFGGSFTDASCYLFHQMSPDARHSLLSELYGPTGLQLNVGRTCIGSSDYSTVMYNYDESADPDPELKYFSIEHDKAWLLPTLREAREINPDLFLFSCVWSPPGWMKTGGSMLGGSMRKHWFAPLAQYFVKFLQAYEAAGVKVQAVTVNNEVDTDQDGIFPATLWGQEYEMQFVEDHLGPALEQASLDTKIWILDHNYSLWGRAVDELSDPGVSKYVDGVAWHSYAGTPEAMSRVHDLFPQKHMYFTEGGPTHPSFAEVAHRRANCPQYGTDWSRWSSAYNDMLRNWARCICVWNLLLDENGRPDITIPPRPPRLGGLVCINLESQQLTRSGSYYAFPHYSKTIKRGARIFASTGEPPGIAHVAAENADGSRVLVITNNDSALEQRVRCTLASHALNVVLPPDSITSFVWS
jgi:glucosylceramidase